MCATLRGPCHRIVLSVRVSSCLLLVLIIFNLLLLLVEGLLDLVDLVDGVLLVSHQLLGVLLNGVELSGRVGSSCLVQGVLLLASGGILSLDLLLLGLGGLLGGLHGIRHAHLLSRGRAVVAVGSGLGGLF